MGLAGKILLVTMVVVNIPLITAVVIAFIKTRGSEATNDFAL